MRYEQIADLLNGIAERFDWDKIMEGEYIIGLKQVNNYLLLFGTLSIQSSYLSSIYCRL